MTTPRVLIADDSPLVLRMIEKMLAGRGLRGRDRARTAWRPSRRPWRRTSDLVILDVMMPRMNGYQACRLLKTEPADPRPAGRHPDQQGPGGRPLLGPGDRAPTTTSPRTRSPSASWSSSRTSWPATPAARGPRPAERQRTSVDILSPRERPARPQALRGHHPLRDRPRGPQPRAVRRDLHLRHGAW